MANKTDEKRPPPLIVVSLGSLGPRKGNPIKTLQEINILQELEKAKRELSEAQEEIKRLREELACYKK